MTRHASPTLRDGIGRWKIRFVLLGGGVAWLLHLVFAWAIAEFGVLSGLAAQRWAGLSVVTWLVIALSVAMVVLATTAVIAAWKLRITPPARDESQRTVDFCAKFGLMTNVTFLAIIIAQIIPLFYFFTP